VPLLQRFTAERAFDFHAVRSPPLGSVVSPVAAEE
jgi:hypothetical protein